MYRIQDPDDPTTIDPRMRNSINHLDFPSTLTRGVPANSVLGDSFLWQSYPSLVEQMSQENTIATTISRHTDSTSQFGICHGQWLLGSGEDADPVSILCQEQYDDGYGCDDMETKELLYSLDTDIRGELHGQQQHHHHYHRSYWEPNSLQHKNQTTSMGSVPILPISIPRPNEFADRGKACRDTTKKERNKWTPEMDQFLSECKIKGLTTSQISEKMQEKFPGVNVGKDSLSKRFKRIQERNPDPFTQAAERAMPRIMASILEELENSNTDTKNMMFAPDLAGILTDDKELARQVMKGIPRAFTQAVQNQVNSARRSLSLNFSLPSPLFGSSVSCALACDDELE
ncbi:hypothetical protein V8F06_007873 [Rhypophila decipiens]